MIGLLCLRPASEGGVSRIVSSTSVVAEIQRKRPDLVGTLFKPFHFDRNDEQLDDEPATFQLPIGHWDGTKLRVFYGGWYIRDAQRHADVPRHSKSQIEVLDLLDSTAADPTLYLDMDFRPGDIQLLKNSTTLHSRTKYDDGDEPDRGRHLLRFWVSTRSGFSASDPLLQSGVKKAGRRE